MAKKYKTKIEITSEAADKNEAMEIVGDYLSGNIVSGIDMRCTTMPVRFYNHAAAKVIAILLLVTIGFLSGIKTTPQQHMAIGTCQMSAIQPPLKTSAADKKDSTFMKKWVAEHTREALNFIRK